MVTFATPGSDESESFTFFDHEIPQCMSGTLSETSVSFAAASVSAVSPLDSDGMSGIEISTSGEASLTVDGAGDWEHPSTANTDRLARNRSFMATYPFNVLEAKASTMSIGLMEGTRQAFVPANANYASPPCKYLYSFALARRHRQYAVVQSRTETAIGSDCRSDLRAT